MLKHKSRLQCIDCRLFESTVCDKWNSIYYTWLITSLCIFRHLKPLDTLHLFSSYYCKSLYSSYNQCNEYKNIVLRCIVISTSVVKVTKGFLWRMVYLYENSDCKYYNKFVNITTFQRITGHLDHCIHYFKEQYT